MAKHKNTNLLCGIVIALALLVTILFLALYPFGAAASATDMPYAEQLFDISTVHTLDITVEEDQWQEMLDNALSETYIPCDVIIDGTALNNVAIRPKGNTSLSQVAASDSDRYSFKIEFDHYDSSINYLGLDKLSLNNLIQDNTYLKDFICYQMMHSVSADAPLCSFIYITVNGEDWGLYLAVEGVEESFVERNYGSGSGQLYKPDTMDMGGGDMQNPPQMGDGSFDFTPPEDGGFDFAPPEDGSTPEGGTFGGEAFGGASGGATPEGGASDGTDRGDGGRPSFPSDLEGGAPSEEQQAPQASGGESQNAAGGTQRQPGGGFGEGFGGGGFDRFSNGATLVYTDDSYESYEAIFESAKFDLTDGDRDRLIEALRTLNSESAAEAVDVDEVIRYFVAHNFVLNGDSYTGSMVHNYYLYEEDSQLSMIAWDYNLAFGAFQMGSDDATALVNYPIDDPLLSGSMEDRPMIAWIFENDTYLQLYHQYMDEWITSFFESGEFEALIDSTIALISPYVEKDPTAFCTYETFLSASQTLKEFCLLRAESIRGQLDGDIPSTEAGQQTDSSALIDASHIDISSMGSMNNHEGD